jgi:hypothetical protein
VAYEDRHRTGLISWRRGAMKAFRQAPGTAKRSPGRPSVQAALQHFGRSVAMILHFPKERFQRQGIGQLSRRRYESAQEHVVVANLAQRAFDIV